LLCSFRCHLFHAWCRLRTVSFLYSFNYLYKFRDEWLASVRHDKMFLCNNYNDDRLYYVCIVYKCHPIFDPKEDIILYWNDIVENDCYSCTLQNIQNRSNPTHWTTSDEQRLNVDHCFLGRCQSHSRQREKRKRWGKICLSILSVNWCAYEQRRQQLVWNRFAFRLVSTTSTSMNTCHWLI
jgi:hypothetical protein